MACECTWTTTGFFVTSSTAASLGLFPPMALAVNADGIGSCSLLLAAPIVVAPSEGVEYSTGQRFTHSLNPTDGFITEGTFTFGGGIGGNDLLPTFSHSPGCL